MVANKLQSLPEVEVLPGFGGFFSFNLVFNKWKVRWLTVKHNPLSGLKTHCFAYILYLRWFSCLIVLVTMYTIGRKSYYKIIVHPVYGSTHKHFFHVLLNSKSSLLENREPRCKLKTSFSSHLSDFSARELSWSAFHFPCNRSTIVYRI